MSFNVKKPFQYPFKYTGVHNSFRERHIDSIEISTGITILSCPLFYTDSRLPPRRYTVPVDQTLIRAPGEPWAGLPEISINSGLCIKNTLEILILEQTASDVVPLQPTNIWDNALAALRPFGQIHVNIVQKSPKIFRTILAFTVQIMVPKPAKTEVTSGTYSKTYDVEYCDV